MYGPSLDQHEVLQQQVQLVAAGDVEREVPLLRRQRGRSPTAFRRASSRAFSSVGGSTVGSVSAFIPSPSHHQPERAEARPDVGVQPDERGALRLGQCVASRPVGEGLPVRLLAVLGALPGDPEVRADEVGGVAHARLDGGLQGVLGGLDARRSVARVVARAWAASVSASSATHLGAVVGGVVAPDASRCPGRTGRPLSSRRRKSSATATRSAKSAASAGTSKMARSSSPIEDRDVGHRVAGARRAARPPGPPRPAAGRLRSASGWRCAWPPRCRFSPDDPEVRRGGGPLDVRVDGRCPRNRRDAAAR